MNLGGENVILGLPWLREHNPQIDWHHGKLKLPSPTVEEVPDQDGPHMISTTTVLEEKDGDFLLNEMYETSPSAPTPCKNPLGSLAEGYNW